MLIEFTVENYRSLFQPMTLSAVAHKYGALSEFNVGQPKQNSQWELGVLPVLGIFGPNASGKSNVLEALQSMIRIVVEGVDSTWTFNRGITPFWLHSQSIKMPTRFSLRALCNSSLYQYTVELTQQRIVFEELKHSPPDTKKPRTLYRRTWDDEAGKHKWQIGPTFTGPHVQLTDHLSEHVAYLRMLVQNLDVKVIAPLCHWFIYSLWGIGSDPAFDRHLVVSQIKEDEDLRRRVVELVKRFDTGISDIVFSQRSDKDPASQLEPDRLLAVHDFGDHVVQWPFEFESQGTKRLFELAYRIDFSLRNGGLLVLDELGAHIHPAIVRAILRQYQSRESNRRGAQLVFASHDSTLMQTDVLRRDEVWLTEKQADGSTRLYPLTDFRVRKDLAVDRAYRDGRFGAVPILPSDEDITELVGVDG